MAHDRTADHYGTEPASTAVLAAPVGRYPAGMDVHTVLADIIDRLRLVEQTPPSRLIFSFTADSVVRGTPATSFVADAVVVSAVASFTADAVIGTTFSITANAVIVSDPDEGCP